LQITQTKEDGAAIEAALVFLLVLFKACWSFLVFSALPTPVDTIETCKYLRWPSHLLAMKF